jgi:cytochrome bd-type quinol oxidase subunit 2
MQRTLLLLCLLLSCNFVQASTGNLEDNIANAASWLILLVLPLAGVYLFWKVHIYPEKVAEKKKHPQLNAIKSMCLLSLVFGGLLWPVALIWANYDYGNQNAPEEDTEITEEELKTLEN